MPVIVAIILVPCDDPQGEVKQANKTSGHEDIS
jgi:hypothetical protein